MTEYRGREGERILTHGYGGYTRGCRCDVCRSAKAAYLRRRRNRARELARRFTDGQGRHLATGITHGTAVGYDESGCRCQPCTSAKTAKRTVEIRRQRERRAS